mgnify:CR=1 FL=1
MQSKEKPVLTKKTFKRELAVVLLIWLVYVVETKDVEIVEVLVWPVFSFAAASFGFVPSAALVPACIVRGAGER